VRGIEMRGVVGQPGDAGGFGVAVVLSEGGGEDVSSDFGMERREELNWTGPEPEPDGEERRAGKWMVSTEKEGREGRAGRTGLNWLQKGKGES